MFRGRGNRASWSRVKWTYTRDVVVLGSSLRVNDRFLGKNFNFSFIEGLNPLSIE